jgi:hypothetical protein
MCFYGEVFNLERFIALPRFNQHRYGKFTHQRITANRSGEIQQV